MEKHIIGHIASPTDGRLAFTADWHFGDDRMRILGRPFASVECCANAIVEAANERLGENDLLVVNGDVAMTAEDLRHAGVIKCKKVLVRGNKDVLPDEAYENAGFDAVYQEGAFVSIGDGQLYVTHYPTRARQDYFNLVGHIHHAWRVQRNMLNIGVDANHFLPLEVDDVIFAMRAISEFYDDDVWVGNLPANVAYNNKHGKIGRYNTDPILIEGDLLDFPADVIGHQTNCYASSADQCGGLAAILFKKRPWAMPMAHDISPALYGNYILCRAPEMEGASDVVNLYGQSSGGPIIADTIDSRGHRLNALRSALFSFLAVEQPSSLALPYKIGCGIAGGDWESYYAMLCDIGSLFPRTRMYLVKLPSEEW